MGRLSGLAGWAPIRVYREPFNLAFRRQTTLDDLGQMDAERGSMRPAGLIFHMSRCGSTLVGQMLAALENTVVLSEAGPIDRVLGASSRDASITDD